MGMLDSIPGIVKPYNPSPEVDWLSMSLTTDWLSRFTEPQVFDEFLVFIQRDFIMIMVAAMYAAGCFLYSPFNLVIINDWSVVNWVSGTLITLLLGIDIYIYVVAPLNSTWCKRRRWLQFLMAFPMAACNTLTPTEAYQIRNCVQAVDLMAVLGIRSPKPQFSAEELSWYCSGTVEPFGTAVLTIGFVGLPLPPYLLAIVYAFAFVNLILIRVWVNPIDEESSEVLGVKALVTLSIGGMMMTFNVMRYFAAIRQFKLQIKAKQETLLAERQEEDVDALLCSMLPSSALERLIRNLAVADYTDEATVLFSDMVSFTAWSSTRTPQQVVSMLNVLCQKIDQLALDSEVEKIKTIGDAYWAVAGLPAECANHAERICDFGNGMLDIVAAANKKHPEWKGVNLRIGVHSGPLNGGILGSQQLSYEVFGETSNLANKAEQNGVPAKVAISAVTLDFLHLQLPKEVVGPHVGTIPTSTDPNETKVHFLYALKRQTIAQMREEYFSGLRILSPSGSSSAGNPTPTGGKSKRRLPSSVNLLMLGAPNNDGQGNVPQQLSDVDDGKNATRKKGQNSSFAIRSPSSRTPSSVGSSSRERRTNEQQKQLRYTVTSLADCAGQEEGSQAPSSIAESILTQVELAPRSKEDAKKKRQRLLKQRAAARKQLVLGDESGGKGVDKGGGADEVEEDENLHDLILRYSKRRWNWFLEDFQDQIVEAEYFEFISRKTLKLRIASRLMILLLLLGLVISIVIQGSANSAGSAGNSSSLFSVASAVLFGISAFLGIIDFGLTVIQPGDEDVPLSEWLRGVQSYRNLSIVEIIWVQRTKGLTFLNHLVAIGIICAAGLMERGKCAATNDITYLHGVLSALVGVGNTGFVSYLLLLLINLNLIVPIFAYFIWNTVLLGAHLIFLTQANVALVFTIAIMEKQFRNQFLQQKLMEKMKERQEGRNREREALLASMVPEFIVTDLMHWMQTMDPVKTIVQTWPRIAVGFIQTYRPITTSVDLLLDKAFNLQQQQQGAEEETGSRRGKIATTPPPPAPLPIGGILSPKRSGANNSSSGGNSFAPSLPPPPDALLLPASSGDVPPMDTRVFRAPSSPKLLKSGSSSFDLKRSLSRSGSSTVKSTTNNLMRLESLHKPHPGQVFPQNSYPPSKRSQLDIDGHPQLNGSGKVGEEGRSSPPGAAKPSGDDPPGEENDPCHPQPQSAAQVLHIDTSDAADAVSGSGGGARLQSVTGGPLEEELDSIGDSSEEDEEDQEEEVCLDAAPVVALRTEHWLSALHNDIDSSLKSLQCIVKIKSIGDIVMLAGPFPSSSSSSSSKTNTDALDDVSSQQQQQQPSSSEEAEETNVAKACDELLEATNLISKLAPVRAGLHVGELVGAVLGQSRLCYDIFGDTVNTTSRAMTSGEKGDVSVSEDFYQLVEARGDNDGKDSRNTVFTPINDDPEQTDGAREAGLEGSSKKYEAAPRSSSSKKSLNDDNSSTNFSRGAELTLPSVTSAKGRGGGGVQFSEESIPVHAKGKGSILIRRVLSFV